MWQISFNNELDRLVKGVGTHMPIGTNTIIFTPKQNKLSDKTATYCRLVFDVRP